MMLRTRRTLRWSPLLLATLPVAGLTLCVPEKIALAAPRRDLPGVPFLSDLPAPETGSETPRPAALPQDAVAPRKPITLPQDVKPAAPPANPNAPRIAQIIVTGNKTLSSTYIILASGHSVGEACSDAVLADMQAKLFATGQFGQHSLNDDDAVRVRSEEPNPPNGECKVIIDVDENSTIQHINITGSGPIKPEEVQALLHQKVGSVDDERRLRQDYSDIRDLYNKRGYIVSASQDSGVDDRGNLNLNLVVTRVGEIKIVGNRKTRRSVILREMNTKLGDYYNRNTFDRDRIRLYNLDLFDAVDPSEYPLGPGRVGLTLNVNEKRTGTITGGIGYSNRAQLIGFAEVVETNFRGLGEAINLRGETGGAAGRSSIELGFTEPFLDRRRTSLNVQIYDKTVYRFSNNLRSGVAGSTLNSNDNRYNEQRTGGAVTFSRPFLQTYRAGLTLRAENVRTDTLNLDVNQAGIIQNGPIYVIGGSAVHNTRDLDLDPVSGGYQTFNAQVGHANLSPPRTAPGVVIPGTYGSVNFVKTFLEARQYISLGGPRRRNKPDEDKTTIALRTILGTSTGTLPFFEQFFVGGADNLRSYRDDRFWGSNLFLGSVELRYPLARKLKGVLFTDIGDAWGGSYRNVSIQGFTQTGFSLHYGVGVGIRVNTPIGPLRLDYGVGQEGARTHFSIGPTF